MAILVNGEAVPADMIRAEAQRLGRMSEWQSLADSLENRMALRHVAEQCAVDRILLRQECERDCDPVDPQLVANALERLNAGSGAPVEAGTLRPQVEARLRFERMVARLAGPARQPTAAEVARFYAAEKHNFQRPEMVQAGHIVKYVDAAHSEEEARAGIEAALAELQRDEPFAAVAERYSDCKENGGDLGAVPRGVMVPEFDDVVFQLEPGQRSGVFRTPFGFHIAEVRSRIPAGARGLDEVSDLIAGYLQAANQRDLMQRAAAVLRARADIRRMRQEAAAAR